MEDQLLQQLWGDRESRKLGVLPYSLIEVVLVRYVP